MYFDPLASLLYKQAVLAVGIDMPEVTLVQGDGFSWLGYPDDTVPSSRDLIPGLTAQQQQQQAQQAQVQEQQAGGVLPSAGAGPSAGRAGVTAAPGGGGASTSAGAAGGQGASSSVLNPGTISGRALSMVQQQLQSHSVRGPQAAQAGPGAPAVQAGIGGTGSAGPAVQGSAGGQGVAAAPAGDEESAEEGGQPPVALGRVVLRNGRLAVLIQGELGPRYIEYVTGVLQLGPGYRWVGGAAGSRGCQA